MDTAGHWKLDGKRRRFWRVDTYPTRCYRCGRPSSTATYSSPIETVHSETVHGEIVHGEIVQDAAVPRHCLYMAPAIMALEPLDRPPLVSQSVQEAIRDTIIRQRLKPGDALPAETELARQLGVGRNSVREAVKSLETLGILEVRRGSGLYVRDFSLEPLLNGLPYAIMSDLETLAEVFDVRRILEVGVIEEAMETMPPASLVQLRQTVDQMGAKAQMGKTFPDEDREFHRLLFDHMANSILRTLLDTFWQVFQNAALSEVVHDIDVNQTYRDHVVILNAVLAGDAVAARAALDSHYDGLRARLRPVRARQGRTGEIRQ